jgi:branched-chain amino acid transport system ATP-binding protein
MTDRGEKLLEIVDVSHHFGGLTAVSGVSTSVRKGEIRGIIGPNGAGKTTLFNLITGELRPSSGRIFLKGEEITGFSPHTICRKGLGRTFQLTFVFPGMTVFDSVWIGVYSRMKGTNLLLSRTDKATDVNERTAEICRLVRLEDKMHELASNLSYGDQKVLEIAMALSTGPSLLLLDEPTQGVGPGEVDHVVELIERLSEDMSILLIEHDMDFILRLCNNLTVLNFGKVIAEGSCDAIGRNEEVQRIYVGESL